MSRETGLWRCGRRWRKQHARSSDQECIGAGRPGYVPDASRVGRNNAWAGRPGYGSYSPLNDPDLALELILNSPKRHNADRMVDRDAARNRRAQRPNRLVRAVRLAVERKLVLERHGTATERFHQRRIVRALAGAHRVLDIKLDRIIRQHGTVERMDLRRVADAVGDKRHRAAGSHRRLRRSPSRESSADYQDICH